MQDSVCFRYIIAGWFHHAIVSSTFSLVASSIVFISQVSELLMYVIYRFYILRALWRKGDFWSYPLMQAILSSIRRNSLCIIWNGEDVIGITVLAIQSLLWNYVKDTSIASLGSLILHLTMYYKLNCFLLMFIQTHLNSLKPCQLQFSCMKRYSRCCISCINSFWKFCRQE